MELANIEKLIEKYENAETTLQEEQVLKDYFQQNEVPAHLDEYKSLFNYFSESGSERYTKTLPLKSKKPYWKWLSIAALLTLMISVYSINSSGFFGAKALTAAEQQEAEKALADTQQAFQLISQNLNKGNSVAIAGMGEFGKAQNKIFKTTKK